MLKNQSGYNNEFKREPWIYDLLQSPQCFVPRETENCLEFKPTFSLMSSTWLNSHEVLRSYFYKAEWIVAIFSLDTNRGRWSKRRHPHSYEQPCRASDEIFMIPRNKVVNIKMLALWLSKGKVPFVCQKRVNMTDISVKHIITAAISPVLKSCSYMKLLSSENITNVILK